MAKRKYKMTKTKADKLYKHSQKKMRSYRRRGGLLGMGIKRGLFRF